VAIGTTSGGTECLARTNVGLATSYEFSGMSRGTTYYVKIRGKNAAGGDSAWVIKPVTMALIIESVGGVRDGSYSDSGFTANSSGKSAAVGLTGTESRYKDNSTGTASATFMPSIGLSAWYRLYATWTNTSFCMTHHAKATVTDANGTTVTYFDMDYTTGNTWQQIGYYKFDAGGTAVIILDNSETTTRAANQRFFSDAIKVAYYGTNPPPPDGASEFHRLQHLHRRLQHLEPNPRGHKL